LSIPGGEKKEFNRKGAEGAQRKEEGVKEKNFSIFLRAPLCKFFVSLRVFRG
jgi:hypothetical protein